MDNEEWVYLRSQLLAAWVIVGIPVIAGLFVKEGFSVIVALIESSFIVFGFLLFLWLFFKVKARVYDSADLPQRVLVAISALWVVNCTLYIVFFSETVSFEWMTGFMGFDDDEVLYILKYAAIPPVFITICFFTIKKAIRH
ncbi:hypothetical protein LH435_15585 [Laribacter hongkongensis]|uniref:hypothetical protein n=1 Tax=Laribacter hongkongensis TaxID=168471 RepID=UPI001EFCF27B|nr:hypothetical protein [Laribacter hongkongensis]MCG9075390.1 hypothetical protein [Laribacter hongkongensis]